ncbi:MAG: metal-dependent hydrolase [Leptospiraceae bacterium]|nr:metal-dependent hydrolase [Leptospiraceae bacterium]
MATFISHGLFASLLIFIWRRKETRFRLFVMVFIASILPDIDLLINSHSRLMGHRGFFHSFFFAFIIATLFSAAFLSEVKHFYHTIVLFVIFFLAVTSHLFLDAMTQAKTGVCFFCPFSDDRIYLSFKPFMEFSGGFSVRSKNSLIVQFLLPEILMIWVPSIAFFILGLYLEGKASGKGTLNQNTLTFKPVEINRNRPKSVPKKKPPRRR